MSRWFALVARVGLAGVWLVAGGSKVGDLAASVRAVHAYKLLPYGVSEVVGAMLPMVELLLGVVLLAGIGTRYAACVSAALSTVFIVGISSAWARGLRIDCGCFGGGGELEAGRSTNYFWKILLDVALFAAAAFLIRRPRSRWSLDDVVSRKGRA
ncbi:MauE/DoxX family redox-associated membrane protein [Virgisporangium aliadipatigenens]|uniref:MauE/DoxX family redox-associated membrane protein n=1 Tax=Virgisporangium aliadipatigenens TaxID=741659 RepID=UPI001941F9D8|nr:MauE/DoxX family redox-associated membrane protein [Virgisporangium aliadipatigenens]